MKDYHFGIYCYTDKITGNIVYIGADSHIDKNMRHRQHYQKSLYGGQVINRVLQNNPDRYDYSVLYHVKDIEEMEQLEFDLINLYRPKFNFAHGGRLNKKFKEKYVYRVSKKSPAGYQIIGKNHTSLKICKDKNKLIPLVEKLNNGIMSESEVKQVKLNPPKYTIAKHYDRFRIINKSNKEIKSCNNIHKLKTLVEKLNNGEISEETIKMMDLRKMEVCELWV